MFTIRFRFRLNVMYREKRFVLQAIPSKLAMLYINTIKLNSSEMGRAKERYRGQSIVLSIIQQRNNSRDKVQYLPWGRVDLFLSIYRAKTESFNIPDTALCLTSRASEHTAELIGVLSIISPKMSRGMSLLQLRLVNLLLLVRICSAQAPDCVSRF